RVLGFAAAEKVGRSAFDDIHPDDVTAARAAVADLLRDPATTVTVQVRLRHADGSWRWVEATGRNLLGLPAVGGLVFNFHDVTERRRSGERLREQAALLDEATDAILVEDLQGRIVFWSRGASRLYGWSADEALGRGAEGLLDGAPSEGRTAALAAVAAAGEWAGEL